MRFPNTGTGFEAEETWDFKFVTIRNRAGSATGHAMQLAEFHLRAFALKSFSLHFFNPSFRLTNLERLLRLPVDTVTILTLGHLARRKYS